VTREKLITLQEQDASLAGYIKEAERNQKFEHSDVYFRMKDGILYRYCKNYERRRPKISQVVIPKRLRKR